MPLAAVQMACVRFASDCIGQHVGHTAAFDLSHALAMAFTGLAVSGAGGAVWLRYLERQLGPSDGAHLLVLKKAAIDYVCWSPTVNAANLFLVPFLTGHGLSDSVATMTENLSSLMLLELQLFGPYNILSFSCIPFDLRPSIKALFSFVFSVSLSLSC